MATWQDEFFRLSELHRHEVERWLEGAGNVKQKRHYCFDGWPQVNRAGMSNRQTEQGTAPKFPVDECPLSP